MILGSDQKERSLLAEVLSLLFSSQQTAGKEPLLAGKRSAASGDENVTVIEGNPKHLPVIVVPQ